MENTSRNRRPWGRVIAGVLACAILWLSIQFLLSGAESRRHADEARVAEPIRLKVDFSKPGSYEGELRHTFLNAHNEILEIVTEPPLTSREEAEKVTEGLSGRFSIVGPHGPVIRDKELDAKGLGAFETEPGRWVTFVAFTRFGSEKGIYRLNLTVNQGAPRLVGVSHFLVARYGLCGMEYMVAEIAWLIAVAGFVVSGVIVLAIVVVTFRKRSRSSAFAPG
jgi:hypothetical protein